MRWIVISIVLNVMHWPKVRTKFYGPPILSALLKGKALDVYALLPSDQALDYDALKWHYLKGMN